MCKHVDNDFSMKYSSRPTLFSKNSKLSCMSEYLIDFEILAASSFLNALIFLWFTYLLYLFQSWKITANQIFSGQNSKVENSFSIEYMYVCIQKNPYQHPMCSFPFICYLQNAHITTEIWNQTKIWKKGAKIASYLVIRWVR